MIRSVIMCIILLTSSSYAQTSQSKSRTQSIIRAYKLKCVNQVRLTKDKAQAICDCAVDKILSKTNVNDLRKLINPAPSLSDEDAAKVENVTEEESSLRSFEFEVLEDCLEELR